MRQSANVAVFATIMFVIFSTAVTQAAPFRLPPIPGNGLAKISFGRPVLPPIGHTRFCLRYPGDCAVEDVDVQRQPMALTPGQWNVLNKVNNEVNRDIVPMVTAGNGATEEWIIAPAAGDCKDYAITKRHQLLALGWPSRALLLAEVVVATGEHHLVLVVRTNNVDLVLDNLNENIRPVAMTYRQYQWIRIETTDNPKLWAQVQVPQALRTAMLSE